MELLTRGNYDLIKFHAIWLVVVKTSWSGSIYWMDRQSNHTSSRPTFPYFVPVTHVPKTSDMSLRMTLTIIYSINSEMFRN